MSGQTTEFVQIDGMALIHAERRRQVQVEGWTPEHDREHGAARLLRAAEAYRWCDYAYWPWDRAWWKPKDHLSNLIRAGALYLAADEVRESTGSAAEAVAREIDGILAKASEILTPPGKTGDA
ncbi:hypothetical protein [Nocardioides sp. URHA0032]|uniref:hypothetical protein n=1 Tax=Nocardioides sp. URHA0032 TaxID=1380388 RepID=UPI000688D519|nr:hypothetical protein [Nocardioides sp. URHA0032]